MIPIWVSTLSLCFSIAMNIYLIARLQRTLSLHSEMIDFLMRATKHLFELQGYKTKVSLKSVEEDKDGD